MGIKIIDIDEAINDNGLKILVYSFAGAGKTVLTSTTGQSTIILSAEGGLLSLKKVMRLNPDLKKTHKVIVIRNYQDLLEAYEMFADSDERLCNWIGLDSISEIAEQVLTVAKEENKDGRAAYGDLTEKVLDLLRKFRDLPLYNVYMSAKMVNKEIDGKNTFVPLFPGQGISNNIPYLFDEVFALRVFEETKGEETIHKRYLQTVNDSKYICKDRSGELDEFEKANLAHIFKKIRGFDEVNFELDEESKEKYSQIKTVSEIYHDDDNEEESGCTYWLHEPSGKTIVAQPDDDTSEMLADDDVRELSFEEWQEITGVASSQDDELISKVTEEEIQEGEEVEELLADEVRYWHHTELDQYMQTEIGDNIIDLLNNELIAEVTESVYLENTEPKKSQPVVETKLQKAKREMEEKRNAGK